MKLVLSKNSCSNCGCHKHENGSCYCSKHSEPAFDFSVGCPDFKPSKNQTDKVPIQEILTQMDGSYEQDL